MLCNFEWATRQQRYYVSIFINAYLICKIQFKILAHTFIDLLW